MDTFPKYVNFLYKNSNLIYLHHNLDVIKMLFSLTIMKNISILYFNLLYDIIFLYNLILIIPLNHFY